MFANTQVVVIDKNHPRVGQAGVVYSAAPTVHDKGEDNESKSVDVKMDLDGAVETFTIEPESQLRVLA